jgi:hypothetical protein
LFGHQTGHNSSKLSKLFKEPLTNWQIVATRLEQHHQKQSVIHRDSILRLGLVQFRSVMTGETKGIDEQGDNMRSARVQYNRDILSSITKTVILAGKQNLPLRGHQDDSQHYASPNPATYRSKTIQNKLVKICGTQIESENLWDQCDHVMPLLSITLVCSWVR